MEKNNEKSENKKSSDSNNAANGKAVNESKKLFLTLLTFLLGIGFAFATFNFIFGVPKIGIIKIDGAIMTKDKADKIIKMLEYAEEDNSIKAVVLEINSPGGEVSVTEMIYLATLKLRKKKPVVAYIAQIGASGAYYIASAGDYIISAPTSVVGSVGVRATLPEPQRINEQQITSGPFKESGTSREDYVKDIESIKENFLNAVFSQRKEKIKISREELSKAQIFTGVEAKQIGLVDNIGSNVDAYEKAAELAKVRKYELLDVKEKLNISFGEFPVFLVNITEMNATNTAPIYYYIYMNPG